MEKIYDVLIVGGGVAGISAGVYAKRKGKDVAIIEKFSLGGQVLSLNKIENFPSQENIDGMSLVDLFLKQVKHQQLEVISDSIEKVDFSQEIKVLFGRRKTYQSRSIVIASGMDYIELGKNENDYLGRGVSYCVVCDANFYKNKPVCVASKNGSGFKSAKQLSEICSDVTMIDSGDVSALQKINTNEKIKIVSNAQLENVCGKEVVDSVEISQNGKTEIIDTNALFVSLGRKPKTEMYNGILKLDKNGFIETDDNMQTSIEEVYAVGDIRAGVLKQIVTACNDGAIAGQLAGNKK